MIKKPKGTYDVNELKGKKILYLEKLLANLMENYHYQYVRTPIFESSDLFHRGVGEGTDIVTKETYDFVDRGKRNMTLRPEGTAGVVRSFIENKMYGDASQPIKTWYYGPMYRYERPQSGRFREFYQFGVEVFGSNDPMLDAEVISIPVTFYRLLGLKGIKVNINSLGDLESRNRYKEALLEYFKPHLDTLCEDCKARYEKNPLRILDCKVDHDLEIMKNVPKMIDSLSEESKKHFEQVKAYLEALKIEYQVNPNLVRGLDYYTYTVFEVEANIEGFGSQNVLCGGGRYNSLVEMLGGKDSAGIGFGLGIERLILLIGAENPDLLNLEDDDIDVYIAPLGEKAKEIALKYLKILIEKGLSVQTDCMDKSLKAQMKYANKINAKKVLILGDDEMENGYFTVRDMETKEQEQIKFEDIIKYV